MPTTSRTVRLIVGGAIVSSGGSALTLTVNDDRGLIDDFSFTLVDNSLGTVDSSVTFIDDGNSTTAHTNDPTDNGDGTWTGTVT